MEIRQFQHFINTCKSGSFSRAAEMSYMTVQGLSMSIGRLEAELGTKLFDRTKKGISISEDGEYLLSRAEEIIRIIEDCEQHFACAAEKKRQLKVIFALGTIEEYAGPVNTSFSEANPDIILEIEQEQDLNCEAAVESGEAELALCAGPVDPEKFDAVKLFSGENVLAVNYSNPLSKYDTVSIHELKGLPLALRKPTTRSTETLIRLSEEEGFELNVYAYVDDIMLAFYLAGQNNCAMVTNRTLVERMRQQKLKIIPFEEPEMRWEIYMIKKKNAMLSHEAKLYANAIVSGCMKSEGFE